MSIVDPRQQDSEAELSGDELSPGTKLSNGTYTIERHLKSGGFGITYLARDTLGRRVVVKECFPSGMCSRPSLSVRPRSRSYQTSISSLVDKFVAEAHTLAKVNHPNIVKVHQVFRENDTAYMALDYVEGHDLNDVMRDPATALSPGEVRTSLLKLLDAIALVHETGLLHRDISPDNILIDAKRNPILIDFGAAREQTPALERAASTLHVVKDGYSPQELYLAAGNQGPWSDLYSLAATFYHVIAGKAPPNSQERLAAMANHSADPLVPLAGKTSAYDAAFLAAIDKAMAVLPRERIQSARQWVAAISEGDGGKVLRLPVADAPRSVTPMSRVTRTEADAARKPVSKLVIVGAVAAIGLVATGVYLAMPEAETVSVARAPVEGASAVAETAETEPKPDAVAVAEPKPDAPAVADAEPAAPPAAGVAPAVASTPAEAPASPVVEDWSVQLPLTATGDAPSVVATTLGDVPGWLTPGLEIVAVNGAPVDRIDAIPTLLRDTADPGEGDRLLVTLTVKADGAEPSDQDIELPVERVLALATGARFVARPVDGAWQTEVQALPAGYSGEMKVGDVVAAHVESNTKLTGPKDLKTVLDAAIAAGAETTTFAVQRGGQMWVASLPLPN